METEAATAVDVSDGFTSRPKLLCACGEAIELRHIWRGHHSCGRLLTVMCGPTNFGAGDG